MFPISLEVYKHRTLVNHSLGYNYDIAVPDSSRDNFWVYKREVVQKKKKYIANTQCSRLVGSVINNKLYI